MNIKTAIFDMDGTLIDSLMLWDILWSLFGKEYGKDINFRPSLNDDKTVRTLILKDAMDLVHKNYGFGNSGEELLARANDIMNDFYATKVELKKGVREFLEYLKSQGVKMCIASATAPELLKTALDHCEITEYFQKIFSCADIGKGKEFPDIFLVCKDYFGGETEETWVFEDSLVAIETAAKIGMPTVGIYDKYNFGGEEIKKIVNEYIADGETLLKLIK